MFQRLGEAAREVIALSKEEAQFLGHGEVSTGHVLLGLLRDKDEVTVRVLDEFGVTQEKVREQIEVLIRRTSEPAVEYPSFSPRYGEVLSSALREATDRGHERIEPEHLLLGLFWVPKGVAAKALKELGADPEAIRSEAYRLIDSSSSDEIQNRRKRIINRSTDGTSTSSRAPNDLEVLLSAKLTARTLERVVAIGQKQEASGVTLALTALEVHQIGVSLLRYLLSADPSTAGIEEGTVGVAELSLSITDETGRSYEVFDGEIGGWGLEGRGAVKAIGVPAEGAKEITVRVDRLSRDKIRGLRDEYETMSEQEWKGPWVFHFSV